MDNKELETKLNQLEGKIDLLNKQIVELNKNSHPMHFMPCKYNEPSTLPKLPPSYLQPLQPWTGPGYTAPVVRC